MTGLLRKSINAKAQERDGASRFKPKDNGDADSDSETSDEDWLDDEMENIVSFLICCFALNSMVSRFACGLRWKVCDGEGSGPTVS